MATRLTAAQERELRRAVSAPLGVIELQDGRRGLRRAGWERMMGRLVEQGLFRPYVHGGYEITELGLEAFDGLGDPCTPEFGVAFHD